MNSISDTNNKMYERAMILFLEEMIFTMKTTEENEENIEKIIDIFNYLNMPLKANQCSSLLETVKRNNLVI